MFAGFDAQSLVALAVVVLSLVSVPLIAGADRAGRRAPEKGLAGTAGEASCEDPRLRRAGSLQA
ncbi:MAG: hypothetical protein SOH58_07360 [Olsenella sp.]|jgi:hypothetical protein